MDVDIYGATCPWPAAHGRQEAETASPLARL